MGKGTDVGMRQQWGVLWLPWCRLPFIVTTGPDAVAKNSKDIYTLMTVFLMTLLNMIGPSSLNCQASIIPWMNSAALILVLAIKCAQRSEPLTHASSCGVAIQITRISVRLRKDLHSMGQNVPLENGATKVTACGRMLTS